MIIRRDVYLNRLVSRMDNGLVKVITGIRRCGKSFLLFELFVSHLLSQGVLDSHIIKVRLDQDDYEALRDPHALSSYIRERIQNSDERYYVLIDEAQYAISREELKDPDRPIALYSMLNGLLARGNVDVYITGSNSKFLSRDVMTEFRGRGDEIHLAPLSFSEFMSAFPGDARAGWREYSLYGGMPHLFEERSEEAKSAYLKHLNEEIYVRDIAERYSIRNSSGMEELMRALASSVGSLTNPQRISDTFRSGGRKGISAATVSDYLRYLEEAFFVQKAERYDIKGNRYLTTPSKYYCTDLGLRNALLNFRQYEPTHLMENAVYNELIYRGYNVDVGVVEAVENVNGKRTTKQIEIDFVVNKGSERLYIQSAYAIPDMEKMRQEQAPLSKIPDSFKKIIVTLDGEVRWRNDWGTEVIPVLDFLMDPNSLAE